MLVAQFDEKVGSFVEGDIPIIERKVNIPWKKALKSNFLTRANAFWVATKYFLRGNSSSGLAGGYWASVIGYIIFQLSITFITLLSLNYHMALS